MKLVYALCNVLLLVALGGCALKDGLSTHQFEQEFTQTGPSEYLKLYADINNDSVDEVLQVFEYDNGPHAIEISDLRGKRLVQINLPNRVMTIKVFKDPRDDRSWIFVSYNDGDYVHLNAFSYDWKPRVTRQDKSFQSIARYIPPNEPSGMSWLGYIDPWFLEDIDKDGRPELICRGYASFRANPRGLMVYDFDTGQRLWYYRTAGNINSIYISDLNADGTNEVLYSTRALKNTMESFNETDDLNSYIGVLSTDGEPIYQDMIARDYSAVTLALGDVEPDGEPEIFCYINTWGSLDSQNSISILKFRNQRLVQTRQHKVASSFKDMYPWFLVHKLEKDQSYLITLLDRATGLMALDEDLNAIKMPSSLWIKTFWDVEDLDADGNPEFLIQTEDDYLGILDSKLRIRAQIKNPFPGNDAMKFTTVSNGFGQSPLICVSVPGRSIYYRNQPVPLSRLIISMIRAYALWIAGFFALLSLLVWLRHRLLFGMYKMISATVDYGHIITKGSDKIVYINNRAQDMLGSRADYNPRSRKKSLKQLFPELHTSLQAFISSGQKVQKTQKNLPVSGASLPHMLNFMAPFGFPRLYVIVFNPLQAENDFYIKQMLWAETARRLSHNVRRHITNIILALEPLESREEHPVDTDEYLRIIKSEIERVRVFTHAFQRFTELKDYDLKRQDILPSVEHCLARIKIPTNVKLIKNWSLQSIEAMIEPIRFEEALHNLITNALDSMTGGGTLHITVQRFASHGGPKTNLHVLVEIEDTGTGISEAHLEDIFKPFYTTKESGTGIGLPESKKIIESMHGILEIQSELGSGTTVSIWLKARL